MVSDPEAQSSAAPQSEAPLEDLMAAMDVVDTLRHEQSIAARELDGEGRRDRLLTRLRNMYEAQGIEVPDHVLEEGIRALEQERFKYTPVPPGWRTKLAKLWVHRGRWGKPVGFLSVLGGLFYGVYFATDVWPERQRQVALPKQVDASLAAIINTAKNPLLVEQASESARTAHLAIEQNEFDEAQLLVDDLQSIEERLKQDYEIRVVSRVNENSGVFRRPPNNPDGRNYYLIVEAIDRNNKVVAIDVVNEENNKSARKKTWGLRVNESTFYRVAQDKKDDGIIQGNIVGTKKVGYLEPEFSIPTTGATITDW